MPGVYGAPARIGTATRPPRVIWRRTVRTSPPGTSSMCFLRAASAAAARARPMPFAAPRRSSGFWRQPGAVGVDAQRLRAFAYSRPQSCRRCTAGAAPIA